MADDIEFGGTGEVTEEELGDGVSVVDEDVVGEVDDADIIPEDLDVPLVKPSPLDEEDEEKVEEEIDMEEASYFFEDDKGFDAR